MPQGLAAEVSAQTADFQAGMQVAQRGLSSLGREATQTNLSLDRAGEAMDGARDDAFAMGAAMVGAQTAADELGDELSSVGASGLLANSGLMSASGGASSSTASFTTLTASTNGLALSFGSLTTSIAGTVAILGTVGATATATVSALVPLAATVSGLTAGLGALAGAFGTVVASGALAYGEQLTDQYQEQLLATRDRIKELEKLREEQGHLTDTQRERLRQLKEEEQRLDDVEGPLSALQVRLGDLASELSAIIAQWGSQFAPLIRDAINSIPDLVRNILSAVGSLDRFADALRSFGQEALRLIPMVAGELATLAREALPILVDGMQWLRNNGGGIFDRILATTRRVAPMLKDIGSAFVSALPSINQFGMAVLDQALPAIESGIRGFGNLLDKILAFSQTQQFEQIMAALRQSANELAPEMQALKDNISSLFSTLVENGPELIHGFTMIADSVLDIVNALTPVLEAFIELVAGALQAYGDWVERSEQQEQNLAEQGVAGYVGSGTLDLLRNSAPQSTQPSTSSQELRVVIDSNDEMFEARVDSQIQQDSRESYDAIDRGAHRGN